MSYHKLLQTLNNKNNQINTVLTYNTSTKKLEFKNNINIQNLSENNFKITPSESIEINKLNHTAAAKIQADLISNITTDLILDNKINFNLTNNNLCLDSLNNQSLIISNDNINVNFNPTVQTVNNGNIYGNLQYVDQDRLISWVSQQDVENEDFEIKKGVTGFEIVKKNQNKNITYITCDPDSVYSNYAKSDIINNLSITNNYNFKNDLNSYTNTLYLRPGMSTVTKEKYLSGFEHTFIIDTQRDLLPGWGFENSHPIMQNTSYTDLKNEVLNNVDLRKKSQTIAIDLSELINSNSVYPGYKINLIIKDPFVEVPDSLPTLFHSNNNPISPTSNWQSSTFDSRYCQFQKSDLDANELLKQNFINNEAQILGGVSTQTWYNLPYYNSLQNFQTTLPTGTGSGGTTCNAPSYQYYYFRQLGSYTANNIVLNYFKPYFMINLGRNNIILNNNNILLKKVESKNNVIPFQINQNILSIINSLFGRLSNKIPYFIANLIENDITLEHLDVNDQSTFKNQNLSALYLNVPSLNSPNILNNLTLKLNSNFYNQILKYQILKLYQKNLAAYSVRSLSYSCRTVSGTYRTIGGSSQYFVYALKTKQILNIPFTNIINTINSNDSNFDDWYYLDLWKTDAHNISSTANQLDDLVLQDMTIENQYSGSTWTTSTPVNVYSISPKINKDIFVKNINQNVISLMYIGKNPTTNKNEWIYV